LRAQLSCAAGPSAGTKGIEVMLSIHGVAVGIPMQATAEGSGHNLSFADWAKGELRIEPHSYAMIFAPAKCNLEPKVLGCLRCCEVSSHSSGAKPVYICFTDAPVHSPLRLTFEDPQSQEVVQQFEALAASASGRHNRSSAVHVPPPPEIPTPEQLVGSAISQMPMVYAGATVYAQSPFNKEDEVFLGEGFVQLLDIQNGRDCTYEMRVYDTTGVDLLMCESISSCMRYQVLEPANLASDGPAALVRITCDMQGSDVRSFAFDQKGIATAFARDLQLRMQVVQLSHSSHRHALRADGYAEQLWDSYQSGVIPTARRWLPWLCLSILVILLLHVATLMYDNPEVGFAEPVGQTLHASRELALASWAGLEHFSGRACEFVTSSVPSTAVERCTSFAGVQEMRSCVEALTTSKIAQPSSPSWL